MPDIIPEDEGRILLLDLWFKASHCGLGQTAITLIALLGSCGGTLHAKPMRTDPSLQVAQMRVLLKLVLDHGSDAREDPALRGKADSPGSTIQEPAEPGSGLLIEAGRWFHIGVCFQSAKTVLDPGGCPMADTGTAALRSRAVLA